ncbi:hypothetical protein B0J13DRAFT_107823 [Dactylonectria estremocensis]|uniref:Uncharacterized protein n=1 Tax=Dactylonectria estremocensis TaxID=1079267 RepID=A0A9P9ISI1_9HYPO|nr:hypothetical protein B0J13DRAFT_107823 [Dactylonectria estremocensis]
MIVSASVVPRNAGVIIVVVTVLLVVALNLRSSEFTYGYGLDSMSSNNHAKQHKPSRLHYLVPATAVKPPLCAVVASALANRFPIPTILGWKGKGEFDAKAAHIAKLRSIRRYLYSEAGANEDDLAIVVDGFDVLAQIPAATVIERYFDFIGDADQNLADQRGLTVEEVHEKGLKHTLVWGTDKGCFPGGRDDPRCWLVPFSTLPRFKWGPRTDNGEMIYSESRFLNSGTVIGHLGDLRTFIDASLRLINETWDPEFKFKNSDQYYISTLYARQEYHRAIDLNGGVFPLEVQGRKVPELRRDENDQTEYHVLVDKEYALTQTQCHNNKFMHKLQYGNFDLTTTITEDMLEEGETFHPYTIQMPASLYQGLRRVWEGMLEEERPLGSARQWIRSLELSTNIGTRNIYAFYHNTCSKGAFVGKYQDSWFFPIIRPLLRASVRAINDQEYITTRPIDGRMWTVGPAFPDAPELQDEFGGVWTDLDEEPFIPLQQFCKEDIPAAIGKEELPPVVVSTEDAPPVENKEVKPPVDNGDVPAGEGSQDVSPPAGNQELPPIVSTGDVPPVENEVQPPVSNEAPPVEGQQEVPPVVSTEEVQVAEGK